MPPTDPRPEMQTTPGEVTSTPQSFASPEYNFTLQIVFELQKSTGQLTEAVTSLKASIDRQTGRIEKLEDKLSGVTHKVYAAGVVLLILLGLGGFIVNKAWDLMVQKITSPPKISMPTQPNLSPPLYDPTKKR